MDLNSEKIIWLAIVGAVAVPAILLLRSGRRDILPYLAAFFAYFGLGPAVNFALGNEIYSGVVQSKIGQATVGILLALIGVLVVGLLVPARRPAMDRSRLEHPARRYHLPPFLFLVLAGYGLVDIVVQGPGGYASDKLERIEQSGPWHYEYLLLQVLACALYFTATSTRFGQVAYWTNFACYVGYCMATNERDFIFVGFSLLLHIQLFRRRPMSLRLVVAGAVAIIGATFVSYLRSPGEGRGVSLLLNEGSTIFPDTFVMTAVPHFTPFAHGGTYLGSLISLVPGAPAHSLADWLVEAYNPGSDSGYGFSLTAEAYMNFGLVGIPVLFAALTLVQRFLVNRVDHSHFYAYASILFTMTWMYNFRGESMAALKTLLYGAILFGVVRLLSTPAPAPAPAPTARSVDGRATGSTVPEAVGRSGR
ncbi:O-antigen polysaccharide polymerase Wzy [Micromonospora sp. CPCC 205711]|uniref:O-antigen polysaccharide polymerase Wzy n=1 Tax=Micromonospora sp. CPCC 205547 TaxID=3122400 RepID=UPI002FF3C456